MSKRKNRKNRNRKPESLLVVKTGGSGSGWWTEIDLGHPAKRKAYELFIESIISEQRSPDKEKRGQE